MIFFCKIQPATVIETSYNTDSIKEFVPLLRKECEKKKNSSEDFVLCSEHYYKNQPCSRNSFFNTMVQTQNKSESFTRKYDIIFQRACYFVHIEQKKTPLNATLCECVHDTCRLKIMIQRINRLGLYISYDELERKDRGLATRTINSRK